MFGGPIHSVRPIMALGLKTRMERKQKGLSGEHSREPLVFYRDVDANQLA